MCSIYSTTVATVGACIYIVTTVAMLYSNYIKCVLFIAPLSQLWGCVFVALVPARSTHYWTKGTQTQSVCATGATSHCLLPPPEAFNITGPTLWIHSSSYVIETKLQFQARQQSYLELSFCFNIIAVTVLTVINFGYLFIFYRLLCNISVSILCHINYY